MLEKNQKKLENKKRRGIWSCARPVTQVVPNRKKQTRQQNKQELRRRIREDSNPSNFFLSKFLERPSISFDILYTRM